MLHSMCILYGDTSSVLVNFFASNAYGTPGKITKIFYLDCHLKYIENWEDKYERLNTNK